MKKENLIKVGTHQPKVVTKRNKELFDKNQRNYVRRK